MVRCFFSAVACLLVRHVASLEAPQSYAGAAMHSYAAPMEYEQNLWEIPPPPESSAVLRPFRLATQQSVAVVYALMAWRATSMVERSRQFGTPLGWAGKPCFVANAAGCYLATRGANKNKMVLKSVLGLNIFVETLAFVVSLLNALFGTSASELPSEAHAINAVCAFWMSLISVTCARSKWIASLPTARRHPPSSTSPYGGAGPYYGTPPHVPQG